MADPSNLEQEMLEVINRLRSDPGGEFDRLILDAARQIGATSDITNAIRFFDVDLTLFRQQMEAFSAVAPLAWSSALGNAATQHSAAMIAADSQSHQLPGEDGLGTRATKNGYNFSVLGENIYAFSESVLYGHAGFVIDWGPGVGGMQTPPGHRNNLLSANFAEVGIGIKADTNPATTVGPLVVTQDLGNRFNYKAQLLGVVFDDGDADAFYDAGEGLGGVTVTAVGAAGTFATTTWAAGGYQFVLPAGAYDVTFSGGGVVTPRTVQATIGTINVKLDLNTDSPFAPATPSVPNLAPSSDSGRSPTDDITNVTTPVLTGTSDPLATVTLFEGSTAIGMGTADATGKWSIKTGVLGQGTHLITARAGDGESASPMSGALTLIIDTTAPAAPTAPDLSATADTGVSDSDNLTRLTTPVFTSSAEALATVTLFDGASEVGSSVANAAGQWTVKASTLADGAHTIRAQATDVAGNVGPLSGALTVTIDTIAPAAPSQPNLATPSDTGRSHVDNVTADTTPLFGGSAAPNTTVTLFASGAARGSAKVNAGGTWAITTSALADGVYAVAVRATDAAGNVGAFSPTLAVTIDTISPAAPVIAALSPTAISGTAEGLASITVFEGGIALGTVVANGAGVWALNVALGAGKHSLTATATDRAGNVSAASPAVTAHVGTSGADVLIGAPGTDLMAGGAGDDTYRVDDASDVVTEAGNGGSDTILASVGYALGATSRIEFLQAAAGAPGLSLTGNGFANTITGGSGADTINGGGGGDILFGGAGADDFVLRALSDSKVVLSRQDLILDFSQLEGDRIELSALDANAALPGDQAFNFIGAAAFSGAAGELRAVTASGATTVSGDVNGDGVADFAIRLAGSHALGAGAFVL